MFCPNIPGSKTVCSSVALRVARLWLDPKHTGLEFMDVTWLW